MRATGRHSQAIEARIVAGSSFSKSYSITNRSNFLWQTVVLMGMPEITVSDSLYSQLENAAEDGDVESMLWEMNYLFKRGNDPSE